MRGCGCVSYMRLIGVFSDAVVETLEFSSGSSHYYARAQGTGISKSDDAGFTSLGEESHEGGQTPRENNIRDVWGWPPQRTL